MKKILLVSALSAASLLSGAGTAHAQDVFRFEEEVLRVKIQKPEVGYVLSRPDINPTYDFELQESFLPRIEASVQEKPF